MDRIILHVDLDSFYASAEKARSPELQGKPVIIGHDPKGGQGRGVVAAASYEARKFGVKAGMPISRAYKKCLGAVYLRPDFAYYNEISSEVMNLLRKYASRFEQASIDEAYMDVSDKVSGYRAIGGYVTGLKQELASRFSLTCSVGVAVNKSIAKIASDINKPDGITIVEPESSKQFLAPLSVSKISGVGPKTTKVLEKMGVKTIGELAKVPGEELVNIFGKNGIWLWGIANALERVEVEGITGRKSISHEFTFQEDVDDPDIIQKTFMDLIDKVHNRLQKDGYYFRTVGIKVRYQNFLTLMKEKSASEYGKDRDTIVRIAASLFKEVYKPKKIRLLGVKLTNLKPVAGKQQSLNVWQDS